MPTSRQGWHDIRYYSAYVVYATILGYSQLIMSSNAAQAAAAAANIKTALQLQSYYRQLQRESFDDVSSGDRKSPSAHPFKYLAATAVWCCLLMFGLMIDQSTRSFPEARHEFPLIAHLWGLHYPENKTRQNQIGDQPDEWAPVDKALKSSQSVAPATETFLPACQTQGLSCPEQESGESCVCSLIAKQKLVSSLS